MKKALSFLLSAVLCLSLFSCYVTPKDEANVLTAEEYFARPFSTEFYGRGPSGLSANGGKLDVLIPDTVSNLALDTDMQTGAGTYGTNWGKLIFTYS